MSAIEKILYDVIQYDQWRHSYLFHTRSSRWTLPSNTFLRLLHLTSYYLLVPLILMFTLPKQLFSRFRLKSGISPPPLSVSLSSCHKHLAVVTPKSLLILVGNTKQNIDSDSTFSRQSGYMYPLSNDVIIKRSSPLQLSWSLDSKYLMILLATSLNNRLMVFDAKANKIGDLDLSVHDITEPSGVLLMGYGPHQLMHRCVVVCGTGLFWFEVRNSGEIGEVCHRVGMRDTHPQGVSSLCYQPDTELLYVGGSGAVGSERSPSALLRSTLSVWRPVEEEEGFVQVRHTLEVRGSVSRRGSDVTSMSLSATTPQMLLTSHPNGTLAVWTTPSLTLHRCIHPIRTRAITETLLSSCWWSRQHVAASYSSGRLAIYELESGQDIVKYDEKRESLLMLQTLRGSKSILAVSYREVVGAASKNTLSVKESIYQFAFSLTRIPSLQQFEVSNFACDYRIELLKQVSPLDLYRHKLAQQLYSEALSLANEFSLDINLLYQNQWESSLFTVDSITLYLSHVTDTNYVLDQIMLVRSPDIDSTRNCIELGLSLIQDSLEEDSVELYGGQKTVILRMELMLECYTHILHSKSVAKFNPVNFRRMCVTPLLQLMSLLAIDRDYTSFQVLYQAFPDQVNPHYLAILIFLPEIEHPSKYQTLLPTLTLHSEEISHNRNVHDDLGELEFYETHPGLSRFKNSTPNNAESLREWFVYRALQIDNISGQYQNAAWLIEYGITNNVPDLLQTQHDIWFLQTLVEDIASSNSSLIGLSEVGKLNSLERIKFVLEGVVVANFFDRFMNFILPILDYSESCREGSKLGLMRGFLLETAQDNLPLCQVLFERCFVDKFYILDNVSMTTLAKECIYSSQNPAQLPNAFSIFECIPKSDLEELTQLEMVLKSASILQNYSIFICPNEIQDHQKGEEQEVRLLILRLAHKLANQRTFPSQNLWEQLLTDILSLQETVFVQLERNTCYALFSQTLMSSQCEDGVHLAASLLTLQSSGLGRPTNETYISDTWRSCLSYEESINVVLHASQQYFNASTHFMDKQMQLARTCLQLVQPPIEMLQEELNLIAILSLLDDFKFDILPAQLRACEDKLKLMRNSIDTKPDNYRKKKKVDKLLSLLKIQDTPGEDGDIDFYEISIFLAEKAYSLEDWRSCEDYCYVLMRSKYANAWAICHRLGSVESFSNLSSRKNLLGYALEHCPVNKIDTVVCSATHLTNQVLEAATSSSAGVQVISKVSEIMGKALRTTGLNKLSYLTGFAKNNHVEDSSNNSIQLSINKHSFYNSKSKFSLFTHLTASQTELFRVYTVFQETATIQDLLEYSSYLTALNSCLTDCLREIIRSDSTLTLGYMFAICNVDITSCVLQEFPRQRVITQLYIYYLALLIKAQETEQPRMRELLFMSPQSFLHNFEHSQDSNNKLILEFTNTKHHLQALLEAESLQEMMIDFDFDFYLADINYQIAVIRNLARNSETLEYALIIARHHGITRETLFIEFLTVLLTHTELGLQQMQGLFVEKGIIECLNANPIIFAEALTSKIYPHIIGTRHNQLIACFELLGRCESATGESVRFINNCLMSCVELNNLLTVLFRILPLLDFKEYSATINPLEVLKLHLTFENIPKLSKLDPLSVTSLPGYVISESDLYFAFCSQLIESYNPSFDDIEVDNLSLITAMNHLSISQILKLFEEVLFSVSSLTLNPTQIQLRFQYICTAINQISDNNFKKEVLPKVSLYSKHMHVCFSPSIQTFPNIQIKNEFFLSRSEPEVVSEILSRYLRLGTPVQLIEEIVTAASSVTTQKFDISISFHDTILSLSTEVQENFSSDIQHNKSISSYPAFTVIKTLFESLPNHNRSNISSESLSALLHRIIDSPNYSPEIKSSLSQLFQSSPSTDSVETDWSIVRMKIQSQIDLWWKYNITNIELELKSNQVELASYLLQLSKTDDHFTSLCTILNYIPNSKSSLEEIWYSLMLAWSKYVIKFENFICQRTHLQFSEAQDNSICTILMSSNKLTSILYLLVTQHREVTLAALEAHLSLLTVENYIFKVELYELILIRNFVPVIMQSTSWNDFLTHFQQTQTFPNTQVARLLNSKLQLVSDSEKPIDIICSQLYAAGYKLESTAIRIKSSIPSRFLSFNSAASWIINHETL